ncbi:MAG: PEP-CTERM sorting domain-containing protein [Betaproteobacteria bacterium]|nr:PEP-CTERM sorting domain-containing protein [Betaproteobacteria bacterium]
MSKWFVAVLAFLLCAHGVRAGVYNEAGDAGDFLHPQDVIGSGITSIEGSIGGDDSVDAFRFFFDGGTLYVTAQLESVIDGMRTLPIALFREDATRTDPCTATNPCLGAFGVIDLTREPLAAGNYVIGACYPPNPCIDVDPPFTIGFLVDPTTGKSAEIGTPVPEPAPLVLLLSGLMALVARRRPFRFGPHQSRAVDGTSLPRQV